VTARIWLLTSRVGEVTSDAGEVMSHGGEAGHGSDAALVALIPHHLDVAAVAPLSPPANDNRAAIKQVTNGFHNLA